jgi:hypothetical protein
MKLQMSPLKKGLTLRRKVAKKTGSMKKSFAVLAAWRFLALQCSHVFLWYSNINLINAIPGESYDEKIMACDFLFIPG